MEEQLVSAEVEDIEMQVAEALKARHPLVGSSPGAISGRERI